MTTATTQPSRWTRFLNFLRGNWDTPVPPIDGDDTESQVLGLVQLAQAHGAPLEPARDSEDPLSLSRIIPADDPVAHTGPIADDDDVIPEFLKAAPAVIASPPAAPAVTAAKRVPLPKKPRARKKRPARARA